MRIAAALFTLLFLAGCTTPAGKTDSSPTPAVDTAVHAPWWEIGESWTIRFEQAGIPSRTTTLVNFANNSFNDPAHFWLGVADRQEALDHVFFDNNPFLGRIHWEILAPHEKGMHSTMFQFPLEGGDTWSSPILFGRDDIVVESTKRADGTFAIEGEARADGALFSYDYDPSVEWFRHLTITEASGAAALDAEVIDHEASGQRGTYYFLRGRDYLNANGGTTGESEPFTVDEEGATSIAFLLDVTTSGPATIEFLDPSGNVVHRETLALGGTADKIVEINKHPAPGAWTLRYVGNVQGTILVRGILEYKATI
jgi:hypothetical protein